MTSLRYWEFATPIHDKNPDKKKRKQNQVSKKQSEDCEIDEMITSSWIRAQLCKIDYSKKK